MTPHAYFSQLLDIKYKTEAPTQVMHHEGILRAHRVMQRQYDEPIKLDDIALNAHFAPHHFHRLYKKQMGTTPHQHLTHLRLMHAKTLLVETSMDLTHICFAVGFSSLGSFSTLFKRHVGYAPSHYRRRHHIVNWSEPVVRLPWCFMNRFAAK